MLAVVVVIIIMYESISLQNKKGRLIDLMFPECLQKPLFWESHEPIGTQQLSVLAAVYANKSFIVLSSPTPLQKLHKLSAE